MSTAAEILEAIPDLTYKQLDHWTKRGYVRPANASPGSGVSREYPPEEVAVLREMVGLAADGILPEKAAELARSIVGGRNARIGRFVLFAKGKPARV